MTDLDIDTVVEHAQAAFWNSVSADYPNATTGDFSPQDTIAFDAACSRAITQWVRANATCALTDHVWETPCDCGEAQHFMCSVCGSQGCHECGAVVILVGYEWLHQDPTVPACFISETVSS